MNREGYDVENAELSMRLYDSELTENIECDMENLLSSQSEGKDIDIVDKIAKGIVENDMSGVLDDYGSKVDALVDSMNVTDQKVNTTHRRKDMDLL